MNELDFLIASGIIIFVISGYKRGFLRGIMEIAGIVFSVLLPLLFFAPAGRLLESLGVSQVYSGAIAFIIILVVSGSVYFNFAEKLYHWIPEKVHNLKTNSFFGIFTGFAKGTVIITLLFAVMASLPLPFITSEDIGESLFGDFLLERTAEAAFTTSEIFGEPFEQAWGFFTIQTETGETVELNFTVPDPEVVARAEQEMLKMVNEERSREGLSELVMDETLRKAARKHSTDMFQKGYFAHVDPDGRTPFDRMREEGISFITAGENLALAPTVSIAHNGLMESPGHRENILRPEYNRIGIGAVKGGRYGIMFTQKFAD